MTQKDRLSGVMVDSVQAVRLMCSEVRTSEGRAVMGTEKQVWKQLNSRWREKLRNGEKVPVPQTDTGRRGENPKTNGRTLVKELGKMTP